MRKVCKVSCFGSLETANSLTDFSFRVRFSTTPRPSSSRESRQMSSTPSVTRLVSIVAPTRPL